MTTRRAPGAVESMSVLTKPRLRWWPFLLAAALPAACRADFRTEDDSAMGGRGGGAGSGASAGAPSWPECIEEETSCPGCETSADCAGGVCDPTTEQCVACLENADCAEVAAPRCESNVCKGCLDADDCAHFEDETLCDPESGACVACRGSEDCDGNVCHPHTKTCTDLPVRQKHACEPCQHDAECQEGQLCVETTYDDPSTGVVGAFCLWRRDAPLPGPQGTCGPNSRPYARAAEVVSVDGEAAIVCRLRTTTCTALLQHSSPVEGCETPFMDDAACGHPDFNDGRCRFNDDIEKLPRCTYPCLGNEDCQAGSSCTAGGSNRYCNF